MLVPLVAVAVTIDGSVSVGGVVSRTVTVNVAEPVLPAASVAVHITVEVPIAKFEPDSGEHDVVNVSSTLSDAVAVNDTPAPVGGDVASTIMLAGTVTTGLTPSRTVTVKVAVAERFPAASTAAQLTVCTPIVKVEHDVRRTNWRNVPADRVTWADRRVGHDRAYGALVAVTV